MLNFVNRIHFYYYSSYLFRVISLHYLIRHPILLSSSQNPLAKIAKTIETKEFFIFFHPASRYKTNLGSNVTLWITLLPKKAPHTISTKARRFQPAKYVSISTLLVKVLHHLFEVFLCFHNSDFLEFECKGKYLMCSNGTIYKLIVIFICLN